eukprot:3805019-Prymnesium_polylepis.1
MLQIPSAPHCSKWARSRKRARQTAPPGADPPRDAAGRHGTTRSAGRSEGEAAAPRWSVAGA